MAQQSPEEINALIAKKRAEVLARMQKLNLPTSSTQPQPSRPQLQTTKLPAFDASSLKARISETKARIEAGIKTQTTKNEPASLHPMLTGAIRRPQGQSSQRRSTGLAPMPRISSIKANQQPLPPKRLKVEHEVPAAFADPSKNPYFDPKIGVRSAGPRQKKAGKQFQFVKPGRFVAQAEKARAEAKIERLKREIAEKANNAKLTEEIIDMESIKPTDPPAIEWWDKPFVKGDSYPKDASCIEQDLVLSGANSLVTIYVQHPVPIDPPPAIIQNGSAPPQLILTPKERKKIRRQRRQEQLREHREKVMMGLLPPDPPKVRLSNFMKILANQTVPDPTRLEAEVRKQVQARKDKHEADNKARQLTKEQRRAKHETKLATEEQKGLVSAVFKVTDLSFPQHRYKVTVNAKEWKMSGASVVSPQMSVVIVEGSAKAVKAYKKLMLRRIDWKATQAVATASDTGEAKDYSGNECWLIWQGEIPRRKFDRFRLYNCPTQSDARAWLDSFGAASYWQLAKEFNPEEAVSSLNMLA